MPTRNSSDSHTQFSKNFSHSLYYQDGLKLKDSSVEENEIIANRPKLYAKLMNVIAFDLDVASFDVHEGSDLIALCSGRVVYLVKLSTWALVDKLGRVDGGAHKGNIRDISIDANCQYIASVGDDKRIAIWNLKKKISEITFEGHAGIIFQVEFSGVDGNLITCSEDGLVQIWDWRSGTAINSFMRHPTAVRAFDFNFESMNNIFCARNDGYISVWNTEYLVRMDNIEPDHKWKENSIDDCLIGYNNLQNGHSGSILSITISPNDWILASGSSDHTCKIWSTISYKKSISQRAEESIKELNSCIDITDPRYDLQNDRSVLEIGECFIPTTYKANLLWTLKHNGPVISLSFSPDSSILATGSVDATCRLWSPMTGMLLFQIDMPSAINKIYFSDNNSFYCTCMNRLFYFDYNVKAREKTQEEMLPTPQLIYANRQEEASRPPSNVRMNAIISRRRKRLSIVPEDIEEEAESLPNRQGRRATFNEEEHETYDEDDVKAEDYMQNLTEEEHRRMSIRGSITDNIPAKVRGSIRSSVRGGFLDDVPESAEESASDRISESIFDNVPEGSVESIRGRMRRSIYDNNPSSVRGSIRGSIRESTLDYVSESAEESAGDRIRESIFDNVPEGAGESIRGSIHGSVHDYNSASARGSIRGSIRGSVPQSLVGSTGFSTHENVPAHMKNSIHEATNDARKFDQIQEEDEGSAIPMKTRNSIDASRKASLNHYASIRASRDKVLSEEYIRGDNSEESIPETLPPNAAKRVSLFDLKNLAAGNVLNHSAFKSIAENAQGVDVKQLEKNMEKYGIRPNQVLRVMTTTPFKPDHILQALSKPSGGEVPVLCAMISRNNPIAGYMQKMGFNADGTLSEADQKRRTIVLEKKDLQSPKQRASVISSSNNTFNYEKWYQASFGAPALERKEAYLSENENEISSDDSEGLNINSKLEIRNMRPSNDKILHFIPSSQMKILKDLTLNKRINPIFLRQMIAESETGSIYPNFSTDTEIANFQPSIMKINKVERFNESVNGRGKSKSFSEKSTDDSFLTKRSKSLLSSVKAGVPDRITLRRKTDPLDTNFDFATFVNRLQPKNIDNFSTKRARHNSNSKIQPNKPKREFRRFSDRPGDTSRALSAFQKLGSMSLNRLSSAALFQPDRYFKTRGLNVRFGNPETGGDVLVSPTVIRSGLDNSSVDIFTKKEKMYKETNID